MNNTPQKVALIISLCFCAITAFTINDYGITWDEAIYFYAGDSYLRWWLDPAVEKIEAYWRINHEHPPLVKFLSGLSHYIFHEKLNLFGHIFAYRLPILIFVCVGNYFLFRFMADLSSLSIAFFSTLIFFSLPRIFFHAHLGAFDFPVSALWIAVISLFWKALNEAQSLKYIFLAAIFLGLALLTKINAFLLYAPLFLIWMWDFWEKKSPSDRQRKFFNLILMLIIPPIMLISFWPWLWQETIPRIHGFIFFHQHHPQVFTYYLGKQWPIQPWHYPFVMTFATLPPLIFFLFLIGFLSIILNLEQTKIFILFNALFPLILIAIPSVPKYDGVRLFLPAFPFISMIAGMGVQQILLLFQKISPSPSPISPYPPLRKDSAATNRKWKLVYPTLLSLFALSIYSSIIKTHPYQSSYYSKLIGGIERAAQKGFEIDYWGNAYIGALPWMNQHSLSTFWVYMADIEPIVLWGFDLYKKDGLLKDSIKFGHKQDSDYLMLLMRQGFFDAEMWDFYKYKQPVFSVKLGQTSLVNIYRLKE